MTVEHKIVVGLEDIAAITLECLNPKGCHSRVSVSPDKIKIPSNCPQCNHEWVPEAISGVTSVKAWPYANFVNSIKLIREGKTPEGQPGFKILLEFQSV